MMRTPVPRFRRDWHDALGMLDSVHEEVGLMQFRHGTGGERYASSGAARDRGRPGSQRPDPELNRNRQRAD